MKKHVIITTLFCLLIQGLVAQNDTIWLSKNWNKTTKNQAAFFRPKPVKKGNLYEMKDYYLSGQLQMLGYSKSADKDVFDGEVIWYNSDGTISSKKHYKNGLLEGRSTMYYNNKPYESIYNMGGLVEGAIVCPSYNSNASYILNYKNNKRVKAIHYFNTAKTTVKKEEFFNEKSRPKKTVFYNLKGKVMGELQLDSDYKKSGIEVNYFELNDQVSSLVYYKNGKVVCTDQFYVNGTPKAVCTQQDKSPEITYYTKEGEIMAHLKLFYKYGAYQPFEGTQLVFGNIYNQDLSSFDIVREKKIYKAGFMSINESYYNTGVLKSKSVYTNGKYAPKETTYYDQKGAVTGTLTYKNGLPFNGVKMTDKLKEWYTNGKITKAVHYYRGSSKVFSQREGQIITYFDKNNSPIGTLKLEPNINYEKPLEGTKFIEEYNSDKLSEFVYKEGVLVRETSWRKGADKTLEFKKEVIYSISRYSSKSAEKHYYSNGQLQSDITYIKDGYTKNKGRFYSIDGKQLGEYDYINKQGTLYDFFPYTDYIRRIETVSEGKTMRYKEYYLPYDYDPKYTSPNPTVLVADVDVNSDAKFYSLEGVLRFKGTFKNQMPYNGSFLSQDTHEMFSYVNGVKEGPYKKYGFKLSNYINAEGNYKNNKREGEFKYYNRNQFISEIKTYKNGVLEGKAITYNKNAEPIAEGIYKNNEPYEGTFYNREALSTYKNGLLIGVLQQNESGDIYTEYEGELQKTTVYYPNSKTKKYHFTSSKTNYHINGETIRYDTKGKKMHSAILKNGQLVSGELWVIQKNLYDFPEVTHTIFKKDARVLTIMLKDKDNNTVLEAKNYKPEKDQVVYTKLYVKGINIKVSDLY